MALLAVENVTRRFGGIVALADVSLALEPGDIGGLIGPNGAGKTTLFNLVTRLYKPNEGRIVFDGKDLTRTPPYRIVRLGIARTFQNVVLFQNMTVLENLLVGAHTRMNPFGERRGRKLALEALDYVETRRRRRPAAGRPPFRNAQAGRARARTRREAPAAPPRRAGRRTESRGGRRARRRDPHDAQGLRPHGAARRAPHEPRDVGLRPRPRAQLRTHDRGRDAGRGAGEPAR